MSIYKCFSSVCMRVACSMPTFYAASAAAHTYTNACVCVCICLHINFTQTVNYVLLRRLIPAAHTCFGPFAPPFRSAHPCYEALLTSATC